MLLARVVGCVWGSVRAPTLSGFRLLEVAPIGVDGPTPTRLVAADTLGAGIGDSVLVAHGSRVRDLTLGETAPFKDVVVAIVDGRFFG